MSIYLPRRLYGLWLVGFSETPVSPAFDLTADSVRPSFSPMTRVGVFASPSFRVPASECFSEPHETASAGLWFVRAALWRLGHKRLGAVPAGDHERCHVDQPRIRARYVR
jgi:hypothetical protein